MPGCPDIKDEITTDFGLADIVADRFDAGMRVGEQVPEDIIAVPIKPELRVIVMAAPAYFTERLEPQRPQNPLEHNCINMRLPTRGGLQAWEFEKDGRELRVRVDGQLVFNISKPLLQAALARLGIA